MCLSRLAQILYAVVCALVVCFILVSTFTTEWTVVKVTAIDRTLSRHDKTIGSRGLLRACLVDICANYDREYVPDWLNGVLACMILALIVAVGAFIWDCITFGACCCRDYLLQPLPVLASLCAFLLCIAVIIYGVKHTEQVGEAQENIVMPNEADAMDTGSGRPTQLGEQDHTECNRRIGELEAQVTYKDIELQNELRRVELLSKTGKGLREEFQKKGVGRSLDERLRQLGLIGTSSDEDESTSASKLSNWYGSCSGIL